MNKNRNRDTKTALASLRPMDYGFLLLSVALTVGSAVLAFGSDGRGGPLFVQIQSVTGMSLYPLSQPRDIKVNGPEGITWLRIENGEVFAIDSPGPRRIILLMGKIHDKGQWLASLPNKVFVRIVSASGDSSRSDVDAAVF